MNLQSFKIQRLSRVQKNSTVYCTTTSLVDFVVWTVKAWLPKYIKGSLHCGKTKGHTQKRKLHHNKISWLWFELLRPCFLWIKVCTKFPQSHNAALKVKTNLNTAVHSYNPRWICALNYKSLESLVASTTSDYFSRVKGTNEKIKSFGHKMKPNLSDGWTDENGHSNIPKKNE